MSMPRRGRLAALAALTVVSVGAGVLAVPASAATPGIHAAERAEAGGTTSAASPILVSGRSSWGFKDTWVRYVTGSGGSVNVAGGATSDATGRVGYPVKHGSVNPAERSADVRFGGSVTYAVPSHGIAAITLANPRVGPPSPASTPPPSRSARGAPSPSRAPCAAWTAPGRTLPASG